MDLDGINMQTLLKGSPCRQCVRVPLPPKRKINLVSTQGSVKLNDFRASQQHLHVA